MSLNINQNVVFKQLSAGQVATLSGIRGFSVLTSGGTCTIEQLDTNSNVLSSLELPDGKSIEVQADGGSLLSNVRITAVADAYVTTLGGTISVA